MKNILLFGTCEYELIGLYHVLKEGGYNVVNATIDNYQEDVYDLLIVALSSVPVIGWGSILACCTLFPVILEEESSFLCQKNWLS